MPCEASRLVRLRFRGYGDDLARAAVARWEGDDTTVPDCTSSPLDARVWLSDWPARALAAPALEARFEPPASYGEPIPGPSSPIFAALGALSAIDPLCLVLCLDGARGSIDATTWRSGLGLGDVAFADQLALALFRALVLVTGAIGRVEPLEARVCAAERWLGAGGPSAVTALSRAREKMGDTSLSMTSFRRASTDGANALIAELERDQAVGVLLSSEATRAFRRALELETETDELSGFEEPLFAWLARQLAEAGPRAPDAHVPPTDLIGFVCATEPSSIDALRTIEHLAACRDDRCGAIVRAEVMGMASVRRALVGPTATPSSWPVRAPGPLLVPAAAPPSAPAFSEDDEDTLPRK
jgi:hypothetical protein